MFGSAEFLGQPKPTVSVQPVTEPVAVMPAKDITPLPKMDMSMKSDKKYSMSYGRDCDPSTVLCRWLGFDGNYGGFTWLLWLLAIAIVWWLLWNIWKWLCGCMGGEKKYKDHDVYTAHKDQKMNVNVAPTKTVATKVPAKK
jgi:hypothetical protein